MITALTVRREPSVREILHPKRASRTAIETCMKQAMPPSEFQKALGRKINLQIPEEPKQFTKAANTGQPVVQSDKRSKASRALNRLVKKTIKIEAKPEEKGTEKPKKGFKLFKKG